MGFFGKDGKCSPDWSIFLDNFPTIGVFKLPHDKNEAYIDRNASAILRIDEGRLEKSRLFGLIDELNENPAEGCKNIYVYRVNGETVYVNLKIVYEQDYLLGFVQDVTSVMQTRQRTDAQSECDELTGLYTRDYFIRKVRGALAEISGTAQCCMAVLHVNGIERVDSELNYDKTSLCIAAAAGAIKRFVSEDVIIGVKSYKDFFVFLRQMAKSEVADIFKKLSDSVKSCKITDEFGNEIQTRSGSFSLSIGYCWYPSQAATIDMMINYADFALFKAMSSGSRDREFEPSEFTKEQSSFSDSRLLNNLIDDNDFSYCFQPIVSAIDGSIYAYEALMRPKNSNPLEVLRIAREHGKLYDIELLTFENVLAEVQNNIGKFAGRKIFINSIPDCMLKEHDFYRLCDKYGDIMKQVVIELTEQSDLTDEHISRLREIYCAKGCMIAIDDYGSGYSNSAAVLNLAPDVIKIDRTLISDINTNTRKQHFLSGIIDFAKLNGIKVLAEGVETYDEMSVSIRRGVDYIQGFFTARPASDIIPEIASNVSESIRAVNINKPEIRIANVYELTERSDEPIDLCELAAEKYTVVSVKCDYAYFRGNVLESVPINIEIAENVSAHIIFENVSLNGEVRPCVIMREKSSARLEFKGNNLFLYDGISVPDTATVVIAGDGDLCIDSCRNNGCCIGSSYNESFGKLVINSGGTLELSANGDHGVCVGGGITSQKNAVSVISGNIKMSASGRDCIGLGSYDGSCEILVGGSDNCRMEISASGDNSVCIGSLYGCPEVTVSKSELILKSLGVNACCIGTLSMLTSERNPVISIFDSKADIFFRAQHGAGVGCRAPDSFIDITGTSFVIYFEGDVVAGIGSAEGGGQLSIKGGDISVSSLSGTRSLWIGQLFGKALLDNVKVNGSTVTDENYKLMPLNI